MAFLFGATAAASCDAQPVEPDPPPRVSSATATSSRHRLSAPPEIVDLPAGSRDLAGYLRAEGVRAAKEDRVLVLYVGATWCEPCERFKAALVSHALDAELPGTRFIATDLDSDADLLARAGCSSKMIPLFARIEPDGTCSVTRRSEGGIKGDGAVGFMLPRVKALLD